jgi:hypothetical protein
MYIIQVKQNPNLDNFIDMAEEEEPAAAKQRMKQLVGEYQSEGRIVEVKAEAKMEYNDYFKEEIENKKGELKINAFDPDSFIKSLKETKINKSPCKGEICAHYNDGECESFDNINDPIVNSEGECQGFKPGGKEYILNEIKRVSEFLDKTPSMGDMAANTDIDRNQYYRLFDGYKDACKQAGLTPNKAGK